MCKYFTHRGKGEGKKEDSIISAVHPPPLTLFSKKSFIVGIIIDGIKNKIISCTPTFPFE